MISVVIPLYNKEASIKQSLMSVLSQSYQDFEVVIVDDGSTDNSVAKVEEIQDSRIRLIRQENGGPSKARNTGVKNAYGEWIVMLDADDELLPNGLETFQKIIDIASNIDIVDCNTLYYNSSGNTEGYHPINGYVKNPMKKFFYSAIGPGSNHSCFKKRLLENFPYNTQMRRFEDADLLMRLLPKAKIYSSSKPVAIVHCEYSAASSPRQNVLEDYFAYLDFKKGGFWRKMCVYRFFLGEREYYPEYSKEKYGKMYRRYDWLLIYKLLNWYSKFFKR
nr:glycosyltransferase family 2 protein [Prevotella sp.]